MPKGFSDQRMTMIGRILLQFTRRFRSDHKAFWSVLGKIMRKIGDGKNSVASLMVTEASVNVSTSHSFCVSQREKNIDELNKPQN